jgi:hypothetical protein
MCNMRSCNQFAAERDKLESNHFGRPHRNLDARNCHYQYHPPLKSLSVVHTCQLCAYRMQNMTICYQFDGVQDYFEYFFCWKFTASKLQHKELPWTVWYITKSWYQNPRYADDMHRGCIIWQSTSNLMHSKMNYNEINFGTNWPEWRRKELPLPVPSTPRVIISSPYMPANSVQIEYEIWQCAINLMEYKTIWSPCSVKICSLKILTQVIAINSIISPLKSLSKSWICHYHAYRMHNMRICKQFDAIQHEL